jgi:hypothetical protein
MFVDTYVRVNLNGVTLNGECAHKSNRVVQMVPAAGAKSSIKNGDVHEGWSNPAYFLSRHTHPKMGNCQNASPGGGVVLAIFLCNWPPDVCLTGMSFAIRIVTCP